MTQNDSFRTSSHGTCSLKSNIEKKITKDPYQKAVALSRHFKLMFTRWCPKTLRLREDPI